MSKKDRELNRAARAAAIRKKQSDRERKRRISIVAVIVLVLGGLVAGGFLLTGGRSGTTEKSGAPLKARASGQTLVVGDNPDAGVKVVVYEDFLCPYCREFESASRGLLRTGVAEGKVLVEYRPFQLLPDPYSAAALTAWGAVLQKGTPAEALAFHDLLYDNQPYEAAADKPGVERFAEWAAEAGVKDQQVLDALGAPDPTFVDAAGATAKEAGVKGTPTVVVNGEVLSGSSIADMVKTLEKIIATG